MDRLIGVLAILAVGFMVGVIVWKVPHVDLLIVVVWTMGLLIWDFWQQLGPKRRRPGN